jgi:hypothetical protein
MDDYVDVAERIRQFKEQYPDGSLQTSTPWIIEVGDKTYVAVAAAAYRTPDDLRPGIGSAWEPVPGPTPFTRDSELMNAETSAWGRAIVALGFETKKIASANEVRNLQGSSEPEGDSSLAQTSTPSGSEGSSGFQPPATEKPITPGIIEEAKTMMKLLNGAFPEHPGPNRTWEDVTREHRLDRWPEKKQMTDLSMADGNELNEWLQEQYNQAAAEAAVPFGSPE